MKYTIFEKNMVWYNQYNQVNPEVQTCIHDMDSNQEFNLCDRYSEASIADTWPYGTLESHYF